MFLRANLRSVQNEPDLRQQFVNTQQPNTSEWLNRQRAIEENLAARVARIHNGGVYHPAPHSSRRLGLHPDVNFITRACTTSTGALCDINGRYVGNFLGIVRGRGEWRSLRCTDGLKGHLCLEMNTLNRR